TGHLTQGTPSARQSSAFLFAEGRRLTEHSSLRFGQVHDRELSISKRQVREARVEIESRRIFFCCRSPCGSELACGERVVRVVERIDACSQGTVTPHRPDHRQP